MEYKRIDKTNSTFEEFRQATIDECKKYYKDLVEMYPKEFEEAIKDFDESGVFLSAYNSGGNTCTMDLAMCI